MQGLGPIFDQGSSSKRKLVWSAIVVLAITLTAINIYTQICMYVGKPINVRVDFKKVREKPFPALTLCNNNFASASAAALYGPYAAGTLKDMRPLLFASGSPEPDFSIYDFSTVSEDWLQFLRSLSQNIKVLRCQWEQGLCSLANFTPTFTDMGFCYTFNMNGTLMARSAGRSYGLKLTLDLQQDDYLRSLDHYYGAGFRVMVHAPEVPPIMSQKGVPVSPGFHNFLAIDIKQLKNADPSVSNCGSKDLKYYSSSYSTEACYIECRTDHVYANCSCRDLYMPNRDVRICDPSEFYSCLYPSLDSYIRSGTACEDKCPEPCSETLYHVTPSANPFSKNFLREFSSLEAYNSSNETYWSQNLLHLEVYLTSMTLETVEKQLGYTLLQLFCDVGGAFGLLLGASLLTILEIVDFIVCRLTAPGTAA